MIGKKSGKLRSKLRSAKNFENGKNYGKIKKKITE